MLASAIAVFIVALAAVRFPTVPLLALMPAVSAVALTSTLSVSRRSWGAGILAAALLARMPGSGWLALAVLVLPIAVHVVRTYGTLHPALAAAISVPVAAYLSAAAGSGTFTVPFGHLLDLCAAVALGATLSAIAYAPTERERLGPGGRAGLRVR
jgi:hypothetical protein